MTGCPISHHGVSKASRGCSHAAASHFSKLFPGLQPLTLDEEQAAILGGPGGLMHDFDGTSNDSSIPCGYIFFAQFIDHDITLDVTSSLRKQQASDEAVAKLPNIRTPSLDLDCVYGFGPEASPHIYDGDRPGRLAIHPNGYDLARSPSGAALIGDPRNDENIFVAQMQLLFHRFHNKLFNERIYQEPGSDEFNRFEEAQKQARYHYQWLVLFDFLKRLCDPAVYRFAATKLIAGDSSFPFFHQPDSHGKLSMPVEFSVAAYRVGHTMVRSSYAVNASHLDIDLFAEEFGTEGFSELPSELAADWRYLLEVDDCIRPRMAKAIDTLLANEIQDMPRAVVNSNNPNDRALAFRNLLRGSALRLPSGQAVAAQLAAEGYPVNPNIDLDLDDLPGWGRLDRLEDNNVSPLRTETPLFYYILRESKVHNQGERLGPVGSAILMEVFGAMLLCSEHSFLKAPHEWNPDPCVSKERGGWWSDKYKEGFSRQALVNNEDYYPFELADVVRFVSG